MYVVDPSVSGGNLTPVATTIQSDYLGKLGYFLIDSTVTPYAATAGSGSTGSLYYPTTYSDTGTRTTQSPNSAIDGNLSTYAIVSGSYFERSSGGSDSSGEAAPDAIAPDPPVPTFTTGDCTWSGFSSLMLPTASTLTVIATASVFNTGSLTITASVGGTQSTLLNTTSTAAKQTYTLSIAAGVDLSTISVEGSAESDGSSTTTASCSLQITEIYVQS